ncbi:uncharacterized protein LOC144880814 [Branchiostoma floridae x Branchiostoma japonicum]
MHFAEIACGEDEETDMAFLRAGMSCPSTAILSIADLFPTKYAGMKNLSVFVNCCTDNFQTNRLNYGAGSCDESSEMLQTVKTGQTFCISHVVDMWSWGASQGYTYGLVLAFNISDGERVTAAVVKLPDVF